LGKAKRLPFSPAASKKAPMLAAKPTQMVDTSALICCMVSYMAIPALIEPPGLFIYKAMSLSGSSASKNNSWAITKLATVSSIALPKNIILSFNKREYIS
jgi:hypothetical protein